MMRWLFIALLLLWAVPAEARQGHGGLATATVPSCPQAVDGGCAASPGGSFQVANFFTGYTGVSYATRPNANMACIDYPCGVPALAVPASGICGLNALADPATAGHGGGGVAPGCGLIPTGCTYSATGHAGINFGPTIDCSSISGAAVIKGFNMGYVGGHEPTVIIYESNNSGSLEVAFNDFEQGGINYSQASVNAINGSTINFLSYANTYNGAWIDSYSNIATATASIGATATGTGTGTTLVLTGISACVWPGDAISGTGVPGSTTIVSQSVGTPCGGTGTFTTNNSTTSSGATITVSSPVLNVTAVASGTFARGQTVNGTGYNGGGQTLSSQLTGTGGATCPDVTCNGTTGTYDITRPQTVASETVTGIFSGGGFGVNTTGTVTSEYDLFHQINGRPSTGEVFGSGNTTPGDVDFEYYYMEGMCYKTGVHCELWEGVGSSGAVPVTWNNTNYQYGTCYQPSNTQVGGTTGCQFIAPGFVASQASNFLVTFTNFLENYTVDIAGAGIGQQSAAASMGGWLYPNVTATNNFISKTGAAAYIECNGAKTVGGVLQGNSFTGSIAPSPSVMTVTAWISGIPIAAGMHITNTNSKQYIVAQLTGTGGATCPDVTCTGEVGTYSLTGSKTVGSSGISSVVDTITNSPTTTGNFDLDTGLSIDASIIDYTGTGGSVCTSPVYQ